MQMEQIEVLTSHRDLNSLCSMRSSSLNSRVTMVACRGVLSRIDSPNAVPVPNVHIVTASYSRNRDGAPRGSFLHKDKTSNANVILLFRWEKKRLLCETLEEQLRTDQITLKG